MDESILSAEKDVLDEFLVGERSHIVVGEYGVISHKGGVNSARIHPLWLGAFPTATFGVKL